ncbi:MAG: hypothetical protein A2Y12_12595 [Planctomycetes bacterium GWF2_42_9]|nr:MAG: hypothetical protein A2Y12_12595 [Planctomycetes bacterium GWF2_42_9]
MTAKSKSKSNTNANAASAINSIPSDAKPQSATMAPLVDMLCFSLGDGASSLMLNTIWGFAMLYYTNALGLDYKLAGIAMAVAVLWDAFMDPIMGYISDNTRSRFGRRHPYILVGGILLAVTFYYMWTIPHQFNHGHMLFW